MGQRTATYKYGLSKPIIAKRTYDSETAKGTYSDAFACGEAMNTTITPRYVSQPLYGDDKKVEEVTEFVDATVDIGSTTMPANAPLILFGHKVDAETGDEISGAGDMGSDVGYGFTSKTVKGGTTKWDACVIYRIRFAEGAEEFQTKGDGIGFVTPKLTGTAIPREEDDKWCVKGFNFESEDKAVEWIYKTLGITTAGE